jgi:hypothetical protein
VTRFSPVSEKSTRDTLLGEVYHEWSNYYRTLGGSPRPVTVSHRRDILIDELEEEYSNKI